MLKMKAFLKPIVLVIVVTMLFGMTVACGGKSADKSQTEAKPSPTTSAAETSTAKPDGTKPGPLLPNEVTVDLMYPPHSVWVYKPDWPIWEMIREKTNLRINVIATPQDSYQESVNVRIASADMPDFIRVDVNPQNMRHGDQGAFVNLAEYLDQMPNFKKYLDENPVHKARITTPEGGLYFLPEVNFWEASSRVWMYREDVFKKHNIPLPSSWEELKQTLLALKQAYPDSYPFGVQGLAQMALFTPAFKTSNGIYYNYDKQEWRFGPIDDGFKTMVEYLRDFYAEGLIAPDFLTYNLTALRDNFAQEKAFVTTHFMGLIDEWPELLKSEMPEFVLRAMPTPKGGPDGGQFIFNPAAITQGFVIASTSKHIPELIKYFDWMYSEEGSKVQSWGEEGVTYTETNGNMKFLDKFPSRQQLAIDTGVSSQGTFALVDFSAFMSLASDYLNEGYQQALKDRAQLQPQLTFTEQELDVVLTVFESIKKHYESEISKFIIGKRNLNEWDNYVNEIKKLNLEKVLDAYRSAHQRAPK